MFGRVWLLAAAAVLALSSLPPLALANAREVFANASPSVIVVLAYDGDGGEGFCLAFDLRKDHLFHKKDSMKIFMPVKYRKTLPKPDAYKFLLDGTNKPHMELLSRKPKEWEYEQEWRAFVFQKGTKKYNKKVLKAVYFGTETDDGTKEHIRAIVEEKYPHAELWQGRLSKTEYKMEFDRVC